MNIEVPKTCIIDGSIPSTFEANGIQMWRCPTCELMWRQSFDVPISHYSEADGGFSETKAKLQRRNIRDRIRMLRKHVDLNNTCDVGGSKGYFVAALKEEGYFGAYGIDPNKVQVEAAQKNGIEMYFGSTETIEDFFNTYNTKNASLFHVIEHLADPVKDISKIHQALLVGGHLIIETPDFNSYVIKKLNYNHKLIYSEHLFYFTFKNLQTFLEHQGFSIVYAGKRDFDMYNLNIREVLFRLGYTKKLPLQFLDRVMMAGVNLLLGWLLRRLVIRLGRLNFSLVVAQKR